LTPEIERHWPVWRLVMAKVATLTEIDTHWSIDDILDAGAVLDMQHHAQQQAQSQ